MSRIKVPALPVGVTFILHVASLVGWAAFAIFRPPWNDTATTWIFSIGVLVSLVGAASTLARVVGDRRNVRLVSEEDRPRP